MVIVLPFSSLSQCKRPSNAKTKNHSQLKAKRRVLHSFRFLFKQIHSFPPQRFNLKQSTDIHGIHIQTSPFPAPLCCQHRDYFRGIFHAPRVGTTPAASPGSPPRALRRDEVLLRGNEEGKIEAATLCSSTSRILPSEDFVSNFLPLPWGPFQGM